MALLVSLIFFLKTSNKSLLNEGPVAEGEFMKAGDSFLLSSRKKIKEIEEKFPQLKNITEDNERIDTTIFSNNIENFIGVVKIPVGLAGPLLVDGKLVHVPIATTEGALVASIARGMKAITESGGISTFINYRRMHRSPVAVFKNIAEAAAFEEWLSSKKSSDLLEATISKTSKHAKLIGYNVKLVGNTVHIRVDFETGKAAGQNMVTSATQAIMNLVKEKSPFEFSFEMIEGNLSSDKKVSFGNLINGRGLSVTTETLLKKDIIERVLRVSAERLIKGYQVGQQGSSLAGMMMYNINFSNVIAGIFTATGQDIACVHESSVGGLYLFDEGDFVRVTSILPSLIVGTVGGGTHLPWQQECMNIMFPDSPPSAHDVGKVIAAACVALDLSTLAAICAGHFTKAHENLGKNRPEELKVRKAS
mgnify:CR=1 FL=1